MSTPEPTRRADPARDAAQLLVRLAFVILFVGVPLSAILSRRSIFVVMPIGAALILVAAALDVPGGALERVRRLVINPVALCLLALLAWAGLSLVWTPFPALAVERYAKTLGTIALATAAAGLLPARTKTSNLYLVPIGVIMGAIATTAMVFLAPGEIRVPGDVDASLIDRSVLGLCLMLWPALGAVAARERWTYGGLVAVVVAVTAIAAWTPGGMLGVALGAMAAATAMSNPHRAGKLWGGLFAALVVLAPAIVEGLYQLRLDRVFGQGTTGYQLALWAAQLREEGLRLITGHGFDTFGRSIASGYLAELTPRSILFEIWYELGVLGAFALALVIVTVFREAGSHPPSTAAFHVGGLVCVCVITVSGESTFQLWWLTLVSMVGVAFAGAARALYRSERPNVAIDRSRPAAMA
jgi:hypothetical protein